MSDKVFYRASLIALVFNFLLGVWILHEVIHDPTLMPCPGNHVATVPKPDSISYRLNNLKGVYEVYENGTWIEVSFTDLITKYGVKEGDYLPVYPTKLAQ